MTSSENSGTRFPKGRSGNPRGRPSGRKNTANLVKEILNRPVVVKMSGKSRRMSTIEAVVLVLTNKAAQGDVRAAGLVDTIQSMAGLESRMTDEARQTRGMRLPNALSTEETLLYFQSQRAKDRERYLAMAEFCGDHGEDEDPIRVPAAIASGDGFTARREFVPALADYRRELQRCNEALTSNPDNSSTKMDFRRAVARLGLLANIMLFDGDFAQALAIADEAMVHGASPFYSAPESLGSATDSISAMGEWARWIALIHANALMLLDRVDEARGSLLKFQRPKTKMAPLLYDWEDAVFREFTDLRTVGYAHPLMAEIEREFFQGGRVRNRDNDLPSRELPDIQKADSFVKQSQLDEAFAIYRNVLLESIGKEKSSRAKLNLATNRIGQLAWQYLLVSKDDAALKCAEMALQCDPCSTSFNLNRAHALMFLRRPDDARAIYFAYHNKMASGKGWGQSIIKEDFDQLRKAGRENRLISEVERRFADALWDDRVKKPLAIEPEPGISNVGPPIAPASAMLSSLALSERNDLQAAEELLSQGRLDEALTVCKRCLVSCNQIIRKTVQIMRVHEDRHKTIILISEISLSFLLTGEAHKALDAADYALSEEPPSIYGNIRRAHALMMLGTEQEARELYIRYRRERPTREKIGDVLIFEDFEKMKASEQTAPLMEEMEQLFRGSDSGRRALVR